MNLELRFWRPLFCQLLLHSHKLKRYGLNVHLFCAKVFYPRIYFLAPLKLRFNITGGSLGLRLHFNANKPVCACYSIHIITTTRIMSRTFYKLPQKPPRICSRLQLRILPAELIVPIAAISLVTALSGIEPEPLLTMQ